MGNLLAALYAEEYFIIQADAADGFFYNFVEREHHKLMIITRKVINGNKRWWNSNDLNNRNLLHRICSYFSQRLSHFLFISQIVDKIIRSTCF